MKWNGEVGGGEGACGAPPASAPLLAAVAPLPQRPVGQGRGAMKQGSGERMGCKLFEKGKKKGAGRLSPFYRGSDRREHKEAPNGFQLCGESKVR
jgi:hypothetical protein